MTSNSKSPESTIFKNFSALALSKVIGDLFTFIFFITISRKFGQDGVGQYSFAVALTGFFVVFVDFGLFFVTNKELGKRFSIESKYYQGVFYLRLILAGIVLLSLTTIIPFLYFSFNTKLIIWFIGLYQVLYVLVDGICAFFISRNNTSIAAIFEFSIRALCSIVACIVAVFSDNLLLVISFFPTMTFIVLTFAIIKLSSLYGAPKLTLSINELYLLFIEAIPYGLAELLRQISTRIDVLFIGFILGAAAAGVYNVAYRVVFFFMFIVGFSSVVILPIASKLFSESKEEYSRLYLQITGYLILVGIPLSIGLWLVSSDLIPLVFGDEFNDSILTLKILAVLLFITFFKSMLAIFLTAADRQNISTKCQWYGAAINLSLNLLLIPLIGINGAAISTIFAELITVVLFYLNLQDLFSRPFAISRLFYSISGSLIFILLYYILNQPNIAVTIIVSILSYILFLCLIKSTRDKELKVIVDYISRHVK